RRPQSGRLGLRLQLAQHVETDVFVIIVVRGVRLQADHVFVDEAARACPHVFDLGRKSEIHGRVLYPRSATIWPPSTTMVAPVMKRPASATSRSSAPSRSRSSPKRPTGISRLIAAPCSLARYSRLRSVTIQPGAMAFTRTPLNASSSPSALVSWTTPAFATA